jgi:hypothetical protein
MICCGGQPLCTGLKGFSGANGGASGNPLLPRTIELHRSKNPATPSDTGLGTYQGREASTDFSDPEGEAILLTNIACDIQSRGIGRSTGAMTLPGNISKHPQWRIITGLLALHTIRDNDILIDDEGYRYQVALNQWSALGYVLDCIRLET